MFFLSSDEAYDNFITMLLLIIHILFMKSELLYTSRCVVGCYPVLEMKFSFQAYPLFVIGSGYLLRVGKHSKTGYYFVFLSSLAPWDRKFRLAKLIFVKYINSIAYIPVAEIKGGKWWLDYFSDNSLVETVYLAWE